MRHNPQRALTISTCSESTLSGVRPDLRCWTRRLAAPVLAGAILVGCGATSSGGAAATIALHGATRASAQLSSTVFGIDVDTSDADIGRKHVPQVLSMAKQAGATAVRFGGNWNSAEPSPGVYSFSAIDQLLSLTRSDRLTLLFGLGREPVWDATNGNPNAPPEDCNSPTAPCTSVSNYVTALVRHTAPEGLHYIISRNEPEDFNRNWVGSDPNTFAHFQQVVYRAAHDADPSIDVLNGGTVALSRSLVALGKSLAPETPYDQKAVAFASALYANPAYCDSLDVLDLHVGDHGPVYSSRIVDASEKAIKACDGGKHVPVWVTEVGYPSMASLQRSPVYQKELVEDKYQGGGPGQANFLTDTFTALKKNHNVVGINWTFMIDPNTTRTPAPGATQGQLLGFGDGLATSSYTPKAAYTAFKNIAER
jgi:hypothetical protein